MTMFTVPVRPDQSSGGRTRASWVDGAIIAGLILFALHPMTQLRPVIAAFGAVLLAASFFLRVPGLAIPAAAVTGALCLYAGGFSSWFFWPAYLLVPIILMILAANSGGAMRDLLGACALGRLGKAEAWVILAISFLSGVSLVGWVWVFAPDLAPFRAMIPAWPIWALVGACFVFSFVNAILEELIWRGVLQAWLLRIGAVPLALFGQAASFGAAHYVGFPGGVVGGILATIYGLMLGALAISSRGLLAPIVAHVAADAVIFAIIVAWAY